MGALVQQGGEAHHDAGNALREQLLSERNDIIRLTFQWKWNGWVVGVICGILQRANGQVELHQVGSGGFDLAHDLIERWDEIAASEIHRIDVSTLRAGER